MIGEGANVPALICLLFVNIGFLSFSLPFSNGGKSMDGLCVRT